VFGVAGKLSHGWIKWTVTAFLGFIFWTIPTALAIEAESSMRPALNVIAAFGFVTASTSACFALAAIFLRYWTKPSRFLATLSNQAYGIYFFHYGIVIWLQYMLLDLPLVAPLKAAIVTGGTLFLSWAASVTAARIGSETMLAKARSNAATLR
jgi:surface polysaccharide O-acyltransferase-like enzyme